MRRLSLAVLVLAAGSFASGCSDHTPPTQLDGSRIDPPNLAKKSHIAIDGVISPGEWAAAATLNFVANAPEALVPATWSVKNDATNLYLAVRIDRPAGSSLGGLGFNFDNDNDGVAVE